MKLARYNIRGWAFREKQKLKCTQKRITKSLTKKGLVSKMMQEKNIYLIMFGLMMVKFCTE